MTLLRASRSESKSAKNRIGGRLFGLPRDPILHQLQALGGLMDVVALGNIGKRLEQLFEALVAGGRRSRGRSGRRMADAASWRANGRPHFVDLSHPSAFPRGVPAVAQRMFAVG
jgi:hypothetical protein